MFIYIDYTPDGIKGVATSVFEIAEPFRLVHDTQRISADTDRLNADHLNSFGPY